MHKMKKIAIMTWYKYRNFGTALQCAALSEKLRKMGFSPSVISYNTSVNKYIFPELESNWNTLISFLRQRLDRSYSSAEREEKFNDFLMKRISETELKKNYSELYELNKEFDTFICGSDQVWSPTRSFDDKYYLSFVNESNNKISYAPSFGTNTINNNEQKKIIKGLLSRFNHISVREKTGARIVEELVEDTPEVVVDPTLLLTADEWANYVDEQSVKKIEGEYILCYFLGNQKKYIKNVKKISKQFKIPYYIIPTNRINDSHFVPFEVGPAEFVSLIKNAKYVCTDSFHGMIFSINFGVQFSVYKRFKDSSKTAENSRIYDMLSTLNLNDRLEEDCFNRHISYEQVQNKIIEQRNMSSLFLQTAIDNPPKKKVNHVKAPMCAGCGSCAEICNRNAISIELNSDGFYQCIVEEENCVDCGMCMTVCPIINKPEKQMIDALELHSLVSKDSVVLKQSSSGGAGFELAKTLISKGYLVCGVSYDSEREQAKHIVIKDMEELQKIQGSKYLQSDISSALEEVLEMQGQKIAFFGTPCQIAGLHNVLVKLGKREQFILIDLICHGITSMNIWNKYISERKQEFNEKVLDCNFRNKKYSWEEKYLCLYNRHGKEVYKMSENNDEFYAFFNRPIAYSPTCYECQFRENSSADIRIGDFWGKKYEGNSDGVSLVVSLTPKGKLIFDDLNEVSIVQYPVDIYWDSQYLENPQKNIMYKRILTDVKDPTLSLHEIIERHMKYYFMRERTQKYKEFVYKLLRLK